MKRVNRGRRLANELEFTLEVLQLDIAKHNNIEKRLLIGFRNGRILGLDDLTNN